MEKERRKQLFNTITIPLLAILSGLLVGAILIAVTGTNPLAAYATLFKSGFSCQELNRCALFTTFERATPLILTGLSAVVAFRAGMFSIGQEGQYLMGSVVAAYLGYAVLLPAGVHQVVIILASMVAGGLYGFIPGWLKVKLGVNELLATIVLNTIAMLFTEWAVQFPMRADFSSAAHSHVISDTAYLPNFLVGSNWGVGFVIALLAAVFVYIYLWRSAPGYEMRMAGNSKRFALFGGIPSDNAAIRAMVISGAIAGLAGAVEVLGVHHRIMTGFSVGLGFDGLSVAILGLTHPVGVVIVAILFAGLRLGAQLGLQFQYQIPRELGGTIIGLIILFVAAPKLYEDLIGWFRKLFTRKEKETEGSAGGGA